MDSVRINYIEFATRDIAATKEFFSTVFGWQFTDYGDTYTAFNDGGMDGGFFHTEKDITPSVLVVLHYTDLETIYDKVRQHGGEIVQEIFEFPGGRRFHFREPGGNVLAVWA